MSVFLSYLIKLYIFLIIITFIQTKLETNFFRKCSWICIAIVIDCNRDWSNAPGRRQCTIQSFRVYCGTNRYRRLLFKKAGLMLLFTEEWSLHAEQTTSKTTKGRTRIHKNKAKAFPLYCFFRASLHKVWRSHFVKKRPLYICVL